MQFILNGPDIPDELLFAHEEGRVVFFCGAGISYPADLPGFKGLVDSIYARLGTTPSDIEKESYSRYQYDATLDLLERRLVGGRVSVRRALAASLRPKYRRLGATDTHSALLELSKARDGATRLVTTNFDRIFDHVVKKERRKIFNYSAPTLPIPKNSKWNGIVYLHGKLTALNDGADLNRLVITSGDFGLAYLTERWAARFASDLFRNYVVCFVGYSINDPVLRYMMDALAADRMQGEETPQAFAFGDFEAGREREKTLEWEAKGVTPILYEVSSGSHDHSALHQTLKAWSETHRDGVQGRERIVVSCAPARPSLTTHQDDFVGRMLWALSHESGLPAKRFAELDPVPSLEWLQPFAEKRFGHRDLPRFLVPPRSQQDSKLAYSILSRPACYTHAPYMSLVSFGPEFCRWDAVMFHLGRWLIRHLGDPELILWLVNSGGHLHDRLANQIGHELQRLAKLEDAGDTAELGRIRSSAPNAIPNSKARVLWYLLLAGRLRCETNDLGLYGWIGRFETQGVTTSVKLQLRDHLTPKIRITKAIRWREDDQPDADPVDQAIEVEIVLACDHVGSALADVSKKPRWSRLLAEMHDDFQHLLLDALQISEELGEADEDNDRSHWDLPSVLPHWQNRGFREWVHLIELLRDAWLEIYASDRQRAQLIADSWIVQRYPTFKRLALFAATHEGVCDDGRWADWLLADEWTLWSPGTQRETMRALSQRGAALDVTKQARLEEAILRGPPRHMFRTELKREDWQGIVDRDVWLRLAKLEAGGLTLGDAAHSRLTSLSRANPRWELSPTGREEFSHWMSGTGDPDFEDYRQFDRAPRTREPLRAWLLRPKPDDTSFYEDDWREICRDRFFVSATALRDLANEGIWPGDRWRTALSVWSDDALIERSWRYLAPLMQSMPDEVFEEIVHGISWWLEAASKSLTRHEEQFYALCARVIGAPHKAPSMDGWIMGAINHPVGQITQALLAHGLNNDLSDHARLPSRLAKLLSPVCDVDKEGFRQGRIILASRIITLFRIDPEWTQFHLLSRFDWDHGQDEAAAMWSGFMWSPRIYRPLLSALKKSFLDTARNYSLLGHLKSQYAALLTYLSLEPSETFSKAEMRAAVASVASSGLLDIATALAQALEAAGEQREEYFLNRVLPFWKDVWPKDRALVSPRLSETLVRIPIAAGEHFPKAVEMLRPWLEPIDHPSLALHRIREAAVDRRFPQATLKLLDALIATPSWTPPDLALCLQSISGAWPEAPASREFQRLLNITRQ